MPDPNDPKLPNPDNMHGAGDEFGGTDEGSHLHIDPKQKPDPDRPAPEQVEERLHEFVSRGQDAQSAVDAVMREQGFDPATGKPLHDHADTERRIAWERCNCGHRREDHADNTLATWHGRCEVEGCDCIEFSTVPFADVPERTPEERRAYDEAFVQEWPIDHEAVKRAARRPELPRVGHAEELERIAEEHPEDELDPKTLSPGKATLRTTRCASCGHDEDEHAANGMICHAEGCECEAFVEYTGGAYVVPDDADIIEHAATITGRFPTTEPQPSIARTVLEADGRRRRYVPPILRRRFVPLEDLPALLNLSEKGTERLFEQLGLDPTDPAWDTLSEVDPVTTNNGPESAHWRQIERIAGRVSPEPAGEDVPILTTYKALALCLLEIRERLGSVPDEAYLDRVAAAIDRNAQTIATVGDAVETVANRLTGRQS